MALLFCRPNDLTNARQPGSGIQPRRFWGFNVDRETGFFVFRSHSEHRATHRRVSISLTVKTGLPFNALIMRFSGGSSDSLNKI
jgi:hypothetical protein